MAREQEPKLIDIIEHRNDPAKEGRAERINTFLEVTREHPSVMTEILRTSVTVRGLQKNALKIEPGADETAPQVRALRAATPVVTFGDELCMRMDGETHRALISSSLLLDPARQEEQKEYIPIIRLGVIAGQFQLWQNPVVDTPSEVSEYGPALAPYLAPSFAPSSGIVLPFSKGLQEFAE